MIDKQCQNADMFVDCMMPDSPLCMRKGVS